MKGEQINAAKFKSVNVKWSPRANGNTSVALKEMEQVFKDNGIETEIILVGNKDIRAVSPVVPAMRKANVYSTIW